MSETVRLGERDYLIVEKVIDKELRYAVNWSEQDQWGVLGGWYKTRADAEAAIYRNGEANGRC